MPFVLLHLSGEYHGPSQNGDTPELKASWFKSNSPEVPVTACRLMSKPKKASWYVCEYLLHSILQHSLTVTQLQITYCSHLFAVHQSLSFLKAPYLSLVSLALPMSPVPGDARLLSPSPRSPFSLTLTSCLSFALHPNFTQIKSHHSISLWWPKGEMQHSLFGPAVFEKNSNPQFRNVLDHLPRCQGLGYKGE